MPKTITAQNNFIRGLVTEATGLNFPENACTDTSNCVFSLIGDVTRRFGIDRELNYVQSNIGTSNSAVSSYRWKNAGGDGETELVVLQIGSTLYFYQSTNSTVLNPLSSTKLSATVSFSSFQVSGNTNNVAETECQFSSGNGYLFVYHPDCDSFYCSFNQGQIQANAINIKIRDFNGFLPEPGNPGINLRQTTLSSEHNYNLQNQGWTGAPSWTAIALDNNHQLVISQPSVLDLRQGSQGFVVGSVSGITVGEVVTIQWSGRYLVNLPNGGTGLAGPAGGIAQGTVISYDGGTVFVDINHLVESLVLSGSTPFVGSVGGSPTLQAGTEVTYFINPGFSNNTINSFKSSVGVYPSNSDIWYTFKDSTGIFNPSAMEESVGITTTPAPRGFFILNAFNQNQSGMSGQSNLTNISTTARPSTGAWFQGRVWYAGVNASQPASGDQNFYTWSENIYFSQIIQTNDVTSFGYCYQQNDPTDENFFDELPTDGGVITIQGCGNIYKLFPIQNGMLVFAANGVWFITGSQGIGFTATDNTITKISSVQSVSSTSFVDVLGLPFFWNAEGIYRVTPTQSQGIGLAVEPLTIGTILSFYNDIPLDSKVYARADYDPINYIIKWVYRSTQESGISNRYQYDSVLNFNIRNTAFYPYSISSTDVTPYVNGIFYINYPDSLTAPEPGFKYVASAGTEFTFATETDPTYVDWSSSGGQNYTSFFVTGYSLQGKGILKFQPTYIYMYSRNTDPWAYTIQGNWDYSINNNSGRASSTQTVINGLGQPNFGNIYRRHKIRGHGEVLQLTVSSVSGQPFDIIGWTVVNQIDAGV